MRSLRSSFSSVLTSTSHQRISRLARAPNFPLKPHRVPYSTATGYASCFEYRWIDGVENVERYQPGGYHPVVVGDELTDRYKVVHKLGYGAFSTIWLARDKDRDSYVAIKVSTANAPSREAEILHALADSSEFKCAPGRDMVPVVPDRFELQGPNGCHRCYVTSPAQSSVAAAKFCDLFTVETARVLATQLVSAVAYIHSRGVVHGGRLAPINCLLSCLDSLMGWI